MKQLLSLFDPISLEEMSGIRLMNRTDTKFVTTKSRLLCLLERAERDYFVQEINGQRVGTYYTLYFDTVACDMFRMHHNGKLNRQKLRIRSYVDSNLDFLEVKTKNNHGRTKKKRIEIHCFDHKNTGRLEDVCGDCNEAPNFLSAYLRFNPLELSGKIENNFERITLVNKAKTERLTIDSGLRFHNIESGKELFLKDVVIIELKRDGLTESPILEILNSLRIKPIGFSKYCMGMAMTDDGLLRKNRFLPRMRKIERVAMGR